MNAKRLIEHARDILLCYELKQLGIPTPLDPESMKANGNVFQIGDRWKRDLREPILFDEEEFLQEFCTTRGINEETDVTFISETFLGCIRHQKLIDVTLKLFHDSTGGTYLHNEYYIFAEISFEKLTKFIRALDPVKMSRFIGFMFNPVTIESVLKEEWGKILDHEYLKDKSIDPIMRHVPAAQTLLEQLCDNVDFGMVAKRSEKKPTEPIPFLLTKPNPRKLPEPTQTISVGIKARPIPKSLYAPSQTAQTLEKIKLGNKEKIEKLFLEAQKNSVGVAGSDSARKDKLEKLRILLEKEEREKLERERPKLGKKVPASHFEKPDIKLTTAAILREDALIRKKRMEEEMSAMRAEMNLRDGTSVAAQREEIKAKEDEERLLELERRRLEIQVLHEDVYEAKQQKVKENQAKVADVLAEKEEIKTISELLKKEQVAQNLLKIESVHEIKEGIIKAKQKIYNTNIKNVSEIQKKNQELFDIAQKEAERDMKRKIELIQQIREVEKKVPAVGTIIKDVDITETSGMGLLSEMSILELQERLLLAKRREREQEEGKRFEITELKKKRLQQIEEKLLQIDRERENRRSARMSKSIPERGVSNLSVLSMRSDASVKTAIIESNPTLKALQSKLEAKKAARLNAKAEMEKKQKALLGKSSPNQLKPRSSSSFSKSHSPHSRNDSAASTRWDELDEAEREFMNQRRELQREADLLLAEMNQELNVPIVELKAIV